MYKYNFYYDDDYVITEMYFVKLGVLKLGVGELGIHSVPSA